MMSRCAYHDFEMFWRCSECGKIFTYEEHEKFLAKRLRQNKNFVGTGKT